MKISRGKKTLLSPYHLALLRSINNLFFSLLHGRYPVFVASGIKICDLSVSLHLCIIYFPLTGSN